MSNSLGLILYMFIPLLLVFCRDCWELRITRRRSRWASAVWFLGQEDSRPPNRFFSLAWQGTLSSNCLRFLYLNANNSGKDSKLWESLDISVISLLACFPGRLLREPATKMAVHSKPHSLNPHHSTDSRAGPVCFSGEWELSRRPGSIRSVCSDKQNRPHWRPEGKEQRIHVRGLESQPEKQARTWGES